MKSYQVYSIHKKQLIVTGKRDDLLWKNANILTDFISD